MKSATSAKPAPKLMSADDALARILAGVPTLPAVETPLLDALGLVLAEDVAADRDVPPFRNSAMDGYAVRGDDVASAPVELRVVGEVAAGEFPDRDVGPGEAMRIMTGAPMPDGADTVVRVEDTDNPSSAGRSATPIDIPSPRRSEPPAPSRGSATSSLTRPMRCERLSAKGSRRTPS